MQKQVAENDKQNVLNLNKLSQGAQDDMFKYLSGDNGIAAQTLKENNQKIKDYEGLRSDLMKQSGGGGNGLALALAKDAGIPGPLADPESVKANTAKNAGVDFFTPITVEISSSSSSESAASQSTAASFGASASWGFFSADVSVSHSNASSEASSAMAKNSCKISFECMRVDITRSWLRAELFYDPDLVPAPNNL